MEVRVYEASRFNSQRPKAKLLFLLSKELKRGTNQWRTKSLQSPLFLFIKLGLCCDAICSVPWPASDHSRVFLSFLSEVKGSFTVAAFIHFPFADSGETHPLLVIWTLIPLLHILTLVRLISLLQYALFSRRYMITTASDNCCSSCNFDLI